MTQKTMGTFDTVLFGISAMLFIDQLTASASFGYAALPTFIFLFAIYIIPYSLVVSELATTYPDEGGIYAWVSRAFGPKLAANVSWWYWINQMLYLPSAFLLFAGVYVQLFSPEMGTAGQIIIAIVLTLLTTWACTLDKSFSKWFPNIGGIVKILIMLIIAIGGVYAGIKGEAATPITREALFPSWSASLGFLAMLIYNSTGWDCIGTMAPYMKNPSKSIPIACLVSAFIVITMYCLSIVGLLMSVNIEQLGLISGFIDSLNVIFTGSPLQEAIVLGLGLALMFTLFTNMITWCMAANEAAMASGAEGELPKVFGIKTKSGTPLGAPIIGCTIALVEMMIYWFISGETEEIYWMILAFSTILFFLPSLTMFFAFIKLRTIDKTTVRPFRIPLGDNQVKFLAVIPVITMIIAIYLLVFAPGTSVDRAYVSAMIIGCVVVIGGGMLMINMTMARNGQRSQDAQTTQDESGTLINDA